MKILPNRIFDGFRDQKKSQLRACTDPSIQEFTDDASYGKFL